MGVMHVCVRAYVGRSFSVRVFFLFGCLVVCFFFFFVFVACLAGVAVGSKRVWRTTKLQAQHLFCEGVFVVLPVRRLTAAFQWATGPSSSPTKKARARSFR